jgi:hypothetical protein
MASLVEKSHAINDSGPKSQLQIPPPQPAPPKITAAKKKEEAKQEEKVEAKSKEEQRAELYSKITHRFHSKYIAKFIPDDIKPPKATDSLESLQALDKTLVGFIHRASKEIMVERMFEGFLNAGEMGMVQFLHWDHARGLSDELLRNKEAFQPELEEIAIELADSWVPNAKTRLFIKVLNAATEFLKHNQRTTTSSSHYEA